MTDIDDLLDQRMTGSTGDYPPWFDEEGTGQGDPPLQDEGDILQGRITEIRDDPFYDPEKDDEPKPILHVREDDGNEWSTRTHSVLVDLIRKQEPEVGDLIRIQYDGNFKTDTGQVANDYQIGLVRAEELEELDEASTDGGTQAESSNDSSETMSPAEAGKELAQGGDPDIDEVEDSTDAPFDPSDHTVADIQGLVQTIDDTSALEELREAEEQGSDRKTAKHAIDERLDELSEDTSEDDSSAEDVPGDVIEFAESLFSFHGELTKSELDEYLNDTRDFDIDVETVISALDVEVDGDTVINQA